MIKISKIKLHNFKRFKDLTLDVDPKMNIFIGDNESGKSSILQAIDLVARGSRTRIEEVGLDRLFNVDSIAQFMNGARNLNDFPYLLVELGVTLLNANLTIVFLNYHQSKLYNRFFYHNFARK